MIIMLHLSSIMAQNLMNIGDSAPEIKVSKWIKGTPVESYERGKIYIVEFWATWCSPCKESIPHLTELAQKYKDKVTIIGIDGAESSKNHEENIKTAEKFVNEMGDKMDYNIAYDTENKYMYKNWMKAAVQQGIPCAFIIAMDAQICWIGHPMSMEKALEDIIAGHYDIKAFAEKYKSEQLNNLQKNKDLIKFEELAKSLIDASKNKDYEKIVSECESVAAKEPSLQYLVDKYYFNALINVNPEKLYSIALKEKSQNNAKRLDELIPYFCKKGLDAKYYDLAINWYKSNLENDKEDINSIFWLSRIYEAADKNEMAIDATNKLIILYKKKNNSAADMYVNILEKRLANLKKNK